MNAKLALLIIAVGLALLVPIQKYIDRSRPVEDSIEHVLYLPDGKVVKRLSFGFDGLMADVYWLRSVQYFGRQLLNEDNKVDWALMSNMRYDLLYPLLDITTTLDPHYLAAYRFGAIFLPDYDRNLALKLLQKGIDNNSDQWRLYHMLGMIQWGAKDYKAASEAFFKGGEQPKAPLWMKVLGGVMMTEGGSRATACKLYGSMLEQAVASNDDFSKIQMENQLKRIQSLDEIDYINELLDHYRKITGRCPNSLSDLGAFLKEDLGRIGSCNQPVQLRLNAKGEPLSPMGQDWIYILDPATCKAKSPFDISDMPVR